MHGAIAAMWPSAKESKKDQRSSGGLRRGELMQSLFYQSNISGANEAKIKKAFEARDCYRAKQSDFSSHILTMVGCGEFKTVEKMFLLTPHQHSLVLWSRKGECY